MNYYSSEYVSKETGTGERLYTRSSMSISFEPYVDWQPALLPMFECHLVAAASHPGTSHLIIGRSQHRIVTGHIILHSREVGVRPV